MKKGIFILIGLWLFFCLLLTGCGPSTPSIGIETSNIFANFWIKHLADNTVEAYAQLRVGGSFGTKVELAEGEHLHCNGQIMTESFDEWHKTTLAEPASDGTYTLSFVRIAEVIDTEITVPDLPTITHFDSEDHPGNWTHGDDLRIEWETAEEPGDDIEIEMRAKKGSIDYIIYKNLSVEDNGELHIDESAAVEDLSFTQHYRNLEPGEYEVSISIARQVEDNTVNEAFQGGYRSAWRYAGASSTLTVPGSE